MGRRFRPRSFLYAPLPLTMVTESTHQRAGRSAVVCGEDTPMSGTDKELEFHRALLGRCTSFRRIVVVGLSAVVLGAFCVIARAFSSALWLGGGGLLTVLVGLILWKQEPTNVETRLADHIAKVGRIDPTEYSLFISRGEENFEVPWRSIVRLLAFKRDLLTTDLICMAIEMEEGRALEINEEMIGWQRTMDQLIERLPGATPWAEWWPKTAFPAFATNPTIVYNRAGA